MKRRKKRRLKPFAKILLTIIVVFFVILFAKKIFNNDNQEELNKDKLENYNITDKSESDKDTIDTIFMKSMSKDDYTKVFTQKENYIKKNGKYNKVLYDFEDKIHYSSLENYFYNFNNSEIAKAEIIGKSVDNRNIYGLEIGKGDKVLFLNANLHAAEVASTLFLTKFIGELLNEYESGNKDVKILLNDVKIAIIPSINPDGYEIYNFGVESLNNKDLWVYKNKDNLSFTSIKCNANGVDINRNFPTQNSGMYYKGYDLISNVSLEKTTKNGKYYNGEEVGSEPETRAAMYFMLKHYKNTYAYIDMHSQGRVIYAGKPNLSKEFNTITSSFASRVSKITNYNVFGLTSEEVGQGNDGSATDFMAELANGFVFSTKTGRLSTNKYKDNNATLKYKYPVITIETLNTWTTDTSVFKNEYYNRGIRELLFDLVKNK